MMSKTEQNGKTEAKIQPERPMKLMVHLVMTKLRFWRHNLLKGGGIELGLLLGFLNLLHVVVFIFIFYYSNVFLCRVPHWSSRRVEDRPVDHHQPLKVGAQLSLSSTSRSFYVGKCHVSSSRLWRSIFCVLLCYLWWSMIW